MKKLSRGNIIAIISIICLILFVVIILIASEFTVYRAETISSLEKSDSRITFMPFSNYTSNFSGTEQKGKYKQRINPNGDFSVVFYDMNGNEAFTALSYGNTLLVEKMRFIRKF